VGAREPEFAAPPSRIVPRRLPDSSTRSRCAGRARSPAPGSLPDLPRTRSVRSAARDGTLTLLVTWPSLLRFQVPAESRFIHLGELLLGKRHVAETLSTENTYHKTVFCEILRAFLAEEIGPSRCGAACLGEESPGEGPRRAGWCGRHGVALDRGNMRLAGLSCRGWLMPTGGTAEGLSGAAIPGSTGCRRLVFRGAAVGADPLVSLSQQPTTATTPDASGRLTNNFVELVAESGAWD
jgi:hypothetical protein